MKNYLQNLLKSYGLSDEKAGLAANAIIVIVFSEAILIVFYQYVAFFYQVIAAAFLGVGILKSVRMCPKGWEEFPARLCFFSFFLAYVYSLISTQMQGSAFIYLLIVTSSLIVSPFIFYFIDNSNKY